MYIYPILIRSPWLLFLSVSRPTLTKFPCYHSDSGYYTWNQAPTTTSYYTYWTPSTTYTTYTAQAGVTVTITTIVPCPVTSTVIYYECCAQQCQTTCGGPISTTYQGGGGGGYVGTTTVTSYTTTTPDPYARQTITSNGLVIVVIGSTGAQTQTTNNPTVVYLTQGNDAPVQSRVSFKVCAAMLVVIMGLGAV